MTKWGAGPGRVNPTRILNQPYFPYLGELAAKQPPVAETSAKRLRFMFFGNPRVAPEYPDAGGSKDGRRLNI
ncbi:hypothetical protein L484_001546 [Morus notabilis]|uniref:Uncharacterized protein n=1 Tax=Morus notabilis TaxID=981085 RepID=W9S298_9ROSA|nr:hypothetical protein L484_001546 [Morus notabilis]